MEITNIHISQKVRPIIFGFLVQPKKKKQLVKAAQIATNLWGGLFFPIIPIRYRNTPIAQKNESIAMLNKFKPDMIINLTSSEILPNEITNIYEKYQILTEKDFVIKSIAGRQSGFHNGLHMMNLVEAIHEKHFRGKEKSSSNVNIFGDIPKKLSLYYSMCFGCHNDEKYNSYIEKRLNASIHSVPKTLNINYVSDFITPITFTGYEIKPHYGKSDALGMCVIYIGKIDNALDYIEFWNIRASGKEVLFIPIENHKDHTVAISKFIEAGAYDRDRIVILKSKDISDTEFQKAVKDFSSGCVLRKFPVKRGKKNHKIVAEDEDIEPIDVYHYEENQTLIWQGRSTSYFPILRPKIEVISDQSFNDKLWAVSLSIKNNVTNHILLSIPYHKAFEDFLKYYILGGVILHNKISFAKRDITIFPDKEDDSMNLQSKSNKDVFFKLLEYYAFTDIQISSAGVIAENIVKQFGHLDELRFLKVKGVRDVIANLSTREKSSSVLKKGYELLEVRNMIKSEWSEHYDTLMPYIETPLTPESVARYLHENNIIRPGMILKCLNCQKNDRYNISEVTTDFTCKYCYTNQKNNQLFHSDLQPNKRRFKAEGLFQIEDSGQGSIPVLLTLWRLNHQQKFLYVPSLNINYKGKGYELDFIGLSHEPYRGTEHRVIIGEVKSHGDLSHNEIIKMKKIADVLGKQTIICFSHLKDNFSDREKEQIKKLISKGYKVIALTKQELELYDLFERFKGCPHPYTQNLDEFGENTIHLNIGK